jgi:acetyl esterase/lipase
MLSPAHGCQQYAGLVTSVVPGARGTVLDPSLFTPDAVDAATAAFNTQLAARLADIPPIWTQPPQVTREAREAGRGAFGPLVLSDMAQERSIPTPAGPLTLRTFVPETVRGVYLFFHGGGWTIGRAHHADVNLEALAKTANLAVVSVDYRLAPEHPYPAGPDDCEAAAVWLVEHARAEFGSDRLLIGGESAGAHLSVVTLLRMRDKHGYSGFTRANLVYGCYDLAMTPSARNAPETTLILPPQSIRWFTQQFGVADHLEDPDVSPIWGDLRSMPPALFSVGTLDPLMDDTLFMYSRWIAAGNQAELAIYPGAVHGFNAFPYALAQTANQHIIDFLKL